MQIDPGFVVVLAAALFFYLRLIILQRERVKRVKLNLEQAAQKTKKKKSRAQPAVTSNYSILSKNRVDLSIAGVGALAMLFGMLLNAGLLHLDSLQPYWWLPISLGLVAFSWAFKL